MQPSPVVPLFLSLAQLPPRLRQRLVKVLRMIHRILFADPSPDPKAQPDDPRRSEPLVTRPKATFQWPPDCLWPFVDQKVESDS